PEGGNGYGPCLFHLLPFVDQAPTFKASLVNLNQKGLYASWTCTGKTVSPFLADDDPTTDPVADRTNFLANALALPRTGARFPTSFPDGTSNTILFAEAYSRAVDPFPAGSDPTKPRLVDRRWWDDPTWMPTPSAVAFQVAPPTQGASVLLPQGLAGGGLFRKGGLN